MLVKGRPACIYRDAAKELDQLVCVYYLALYALKEIQSQVETEGSSYTNPLRCPYFSLRPTDVRKYIPASAAELQEH